LVAHGCVEIIYPETTFVRDAATIHFDAIPDVHALLAFPWGQHSKDDDLPPPVVKPRGFPKDVGGLVLHETTLYIDAKQAKDPTNPRAITAREAKTLKPFKAKSYTAYFDPDVKCPTWLTRTEVALAAEKYLRRCGHASADLEAVEMMMKEYERQVFNGEHPTTRLVVWFT
jgi:hypothetical protein